MVTYNLIYLTRVNLFTDQQPRSQFVLPSYRPSRYQKGKKSWERG